jgi:membrane protease subunit HflK
VPVKRVYEVAINTLSGRAEAEEYAADTLNPVTQGYALTGDHNVVEADVVVRYRIRDAAEWAFYGPTPDDVLRVEVTTAMVRSLGETAVDRVLSDGRKDLIALATRRAQAGLDACHSGLEVSSIELTRLAPPPSLIPEFDAVQSAYIGAETRRKEAQAFAATAIPQAQSAADTMLQSARGASESESAAARGAADAFHALDGEYRANAAVVRERLYRDAVELALRSSGRVRWIPAPIGGKYNNFRVSIPSGGQGTPVIVEDEDEK